jgi:hypothetical protein
MSRITPKERLLALPSWIRCYKASYDGGLRYVLRERDYRFLLKWARRGVESKPCKKRQ